MKKRIFSILLAFTMVIVGTIGTSGVGVLAADSISDINTQITIDDLIKMTDKELTEVPQSILKNVINEVSKYDKIEYSKYEEQDLQRILDQFLANAQEIIYEQIAKDLPSTSKSTGLDLGVSVTVTWAEDGDSGFEEAGIADWGRNYDDETCESFILVGPGYGSATAWARTGHTFAINGSSGSAYYRIDMDCEWHCGSLLNGTDTLTLLVEQWKNNVYTPFTYIIDSYDSTYGYHTEDFEYSTPTNIRLYAGATYRISLMVETSGTATWAEVVGADCMSSDREASWSYLHLEYDP